MAFRQIILAALVGVVAAAGARAADVDVRAPGHGDFRLHVTSLRDLPFRTVVRQQYDFSCGSASLATLLRFHYGTAKTEAEVFQAMYALGDREQIRRLGFSLLDMKRYLAAQGMTADGYRLPLSAVAEAETPAIVVVNVDGYKHFVVVKGMRGGEILIGDPNRGVVSYPVRRFEKIWDGVIFVIRGREDGRALTPRFNSDADWALVPNAPFQGALDQSKSIAEITQNLPITHRIAAGLTSQLQGALP